MRYLLLLLLLSLPVAGALRAQPVYWRGTNAEFGASVQALVVTRTGAIFAATEGKGLFRSTDEGETWTRRTTGLTDDDIFTLATDSDGRIFAGGYNQGIFRSTNGGDTWIEIGEARTRALLVTPADEIFWGRGTGLSRSTDHGASWNEIPTAPAGTVGTIALDSTGSIYISILNDGEIWRSDDDGDTWSKTSFLDPLSGSIRTIIAGPNGLLYAGHRGFYRSSDKGESWEEPATTPLPPFLRGGMGPDGHLFLTAGAGVYESSDFGATWMLQGSGWLGDAGESYSLTFDAQRRIVVGTTKGMVLISRDATSGKDEEISQREGSALSIDAISPNPCRDRAVMRVSLPRASRIRTTIYSAAGEMVGAAPAHDLPAGTHDLPITAAGLPTGVYLLRVEIDGTTATKLLSVIGE